GRDADAPERAHLRGVVLTHVLAASGGSLLVARALPLRPFDPRPLSARAARCDGGPGRRCGGQGAARSGHAHRGTEADVLVLDAVDPLDARAVREAPASLVRRVAYRALRR